MSHNPVPTENENENEDGFVLVKKRTRPPPSSRERITDVTQHVRSFYDRRGRGETRQERQQSALYQLRVHHNWIKAMLIHKSCPPNQSVLDLCCGKGGDVLKWHKAQVAYLFCVDNSSVSIQEAKRRYQQLRGARWPADFLCLNCFTDSIESHIPKGKEFQLVSCQFALHYAFSSGATAHQLFQNITCRLAPGGLVLCTFPRAELICDRLRSGKPLGNSLYRIKDLSGIAQQTDLEHYGLLYNFEMQECVNSPEYLVSMKLFTLLASSFGLEIEFHYTFDVIPGLPRTRHEQELYESMRVEPLSAEQQEISSMFHSMYVVI